MLDCRSGAVFAELSDDAQISLGARADERFFRALASVDIALNSGSDENLLGEILAFTGGTDALAREFWKLVINAAR